MLERHTPAPHIPGPEHPNSLPWAPRRHIQACYLLPEFHDGGRDVLGRARGAGCGVVQEVHAMLCGGQGGVHSGSGRQTCPHILSPTLWPAGPIIPVLGSPRFPVSGVPPREAQPPLPPNLTAPLGPPPATSDPIQTSGLSPHPPCGTALPSDGGPAGPTLWSPGSGAQ